MSRITVVDSDSAYRSKHYPGKDSVDKKALEFLVSHYRSLYCVYRVALHVYTTVSNYLIRSRTISELRPGNIKVLLLSVNRHASVIKRFLQMEREQMLRKYQKASASSIISIWNKMMVIRLRDKTPLNESNIGPDSTAAASAQVARRIIDVSVSPHVLRN
ncbi:hypothetical protein CHS0354_027805 [Potamilus streckersoni]|uniref:Uncharacterized protein n=1 Tax=Potamilus streckersoni TaxID=2493646 RepID=A0AAE0T0I0_9BIVA|nr:hypothetical protein CHS0354_027805 [Potamilus streckersoni]